MSSTGALAAERERLEREIQKLSVGLPEGAAEVVRRADEIMAEHGSKLAALKARRDEIDRAFDVTERERRAAEEAAQVAQVAAAKKALTDAANTYLEAVGAAEEAARKLADSVHRAFEANARLSALARDLAPDGKVPGALNVMELEKRLALRIASVLSTVPRHQVRLGDLVWPSAARSFYPPATSWVEAEERRLGAHVLQPLIEKGTDQ